MAEETKPFIKEVGTAGLGRYEGAKRVMALSQAGPQLKGYALQAVLDHATSYGMDPDNALLGRELAESQANLRAGQGLSYGLTSWMAQDAEKHGIVSEHASVGEYVSHVGPELDDEDAEFLEGHKDLLMKDIDSIEDEEVKTRLKRIMGSVEQHYEVGQLVGKYLTTVTQPNYKPGGLESKI